MKKVIAMITLSFIGFNSMGQTQTINTTPTVQASINDPIIFNNSDNLRRTITQYSWRGETYKNDFLRIANARGTGGTPQGFIPMIHGNSATGGAGLVLLSNIPTSNDNGTSPIMGFVTRNGFVAEGYDNPSVGLPVATRPLFQWINGVTPQMTMAANGSLGIGIVNPSARVHIRTDKATLANEKISTEDVTLELAVAANNGEYGVQKGDAFIWTNQTSTTKNLRGNLYLNTGSQSNVNTPNSRNIILGSLNRNTLVVSDAGRVGIGLDNLGSPIATITRPDRLLHVNSRNVADIRFQNLPSKRCGFVLMVDENGDVYRTPNSGDPCIESCSTSGMPTTNIIQRFEELAKKYEVLSKEVETLKSKVK